MDRKTEREIIRTLCTAGHDDLAKAFARERGYRIVAAKGPPIESLKRGMKLQLSVRYDDDPKVFNIRGTVARDAYDFGSGWVDVDFKVIKDRETRSVVVT